MFQQIDFLKLLTNKVQNFIGQRRRLVIGQDMRQWLVIVSEV
jgi:hypothetical protein